MCSRGCIVLFLLVWKAKTVQLASYDKCVRLIHYIFVLPLSFIPYYKHTSFLSALGTNETLKCADSAPLIDFTNRFVLL